MDKEYYKVGGMVLVSLFLGMTALLASFGAASAFETPGTTSIREISAACVAAALYLAFCQFWVAPRGAAGSGRNCPPWSPPLPRCWWAWSPGHRGLRAFLGWLPAALAA